MEETKPRQLTKEEVRALAEYHLEKAQELFKTLGEKGLVKLK